MFAQAARAPRAVSFGVGNKISEDLLETATTFLNSTAKYKINCILL